MYLINGKSEDTLAAADRGFQYGDGVFTTMRVNDGVIDAWPRHLERLKSNVSALAIDGVDWQGVTQWVVQAAHSLNAECSAVMKVIISRGAGGRGYSAQGCISPTVVVSTHPFPRSYLTWQEKGITLALLTQRIGLSPLAGLKHLNRLEQVLLKGEVEALGVDDGIACDMNGFITETSASNLFWRKDRTLFTPVLDNAGVAGTMRARVMETAKMLGYDVNECRVLAEAIDSAEEIFITNAVMGLVPVRQYHNKNYNDFEACRAISLRLTA